MDSDRFDAATRALTDLASRRAALGVTLSGMLSALTLADATARKKRKRKKKKKKNTTTCRSGTRLCNDTCIPVNDCCTDADCGGNACEGGQCGECPDGHRRCGIGSCVPQGECCSDTECTGGKLSVDGACRCRPNQRECQGVCIPGDECCEDVECSGGETCQAGVCRCPAGQHLCEGTCIANGTCCNNADCPSGSRCVDDQCIVWEGTCPAGYSRCNSTSTQPCNSNSNCICAETVHGETWCWQYNTVTSNCGSCTSDAQCANFAPGSFCVSCCGNPATYACAYPCPS